MASSRSFEFVGGSSAKFWEVTRDGVEVTVRYGRIGTTGQTTHKSFATEAAATTHVDKLVAEKVGKGYAEPVAGAPALVVEPDRPSTTGSGSTVPAGATALSGATALPGAGAPVRPSGPDVDEDAFVMPSSWHRSVFARRGGVAVAAPRPDPAARAKAVALLAKLAEAVDQSLRHSQTEPAVAEAGLEQLAGTPSPLGAGAVAAALVSGATWADRDEPRVLADRWLADLGLQFAVAAAVELLSLGWSSRGSHHPGGRPLRHLRPNESRSWWGHEGGLTVAGRVRAALAAAPDDGYAAALAALLPYRQGTLHQRVAAAFLAPTETDWHDETLTEVLAAGNGGLAALLLTVVSAPAHAARAVDLAELSAILHSAPMVYSFAVGVGPAAAPTLADWFDTAYADADAKRRLLAVLAALPGDLPLQLLLDRLDQKYVAAAAIEAAGRFPARALRLLAGTMTRGAGDLLQAHVLAHPEVVERVLPTLPEAAADRIRAVLAQTTAVREAPPEAVPTLLARPPWTVDRPTGRPVLVDGLVCRD